MNSLLVWPLSLVDEIIFSSVNATLANITCCDPIDFTLKAGQINYQLISGLTGCQLSSFKKDLLLVINKEKKEINLADILFVSSSSLGHVLIKIIYKKETLAYFILSLDTIKAWVTQLDLLEVVMQENENEKNSRGTGCC